MGACFMETSSLNIAYVRTPLGRSNLSVYESVLTCWSSIIVLRLELASHLVCGISHLNLSKMGPQ